MLPIPFFKNDGDGSQCMQVAMKSVIAYFLHQDISLEKLDILTGRKKNLWTRTSQGVIVLHEMWLNVTYFSKSDITPFLWGRSYIKKHFWKDAETILKHSDVPVLIESITWLLNYDIFKQEETGVEQLEKAVQQWHVPIVLIDANRIRWKKASFQGHFVVITWFDDEHIYYHDSWPTDPEANKQVTKSLFLQAMQANWTDNDVLIIYDKQ